MKRLRVKDKQSDTFRSLFCLSGDNTAYLLRIHAPANGAPRLFCMRHFDFFSENDAKSQPWQNTASGYCFTKELKQNGSLHHNFRT